MATKNKKRWFIGCDYCYTSDECWRAVRLFINGVLGSVVYYYDLLDDRASHNGASIRLGDAVKYAPGILADDVDISDMQREIFMRDLSNVVYDTMLKKMACLARDTAYELNLVRAEYVIGLEFGNTLSVDTRFVIFGDEDEGGDSIWLMDVDISEDKLNDIIGLDRWKIYSLGDTYAHIGNEHYIDVDELDVFWYEYKFLYFNTISNIT